MTKSFEVLPPHMPDFIKFKQEPTSRETGLTQNIKAFNRKLTQQEAEEYAELMQYFIYQALGG